MKQFTRLLFTVSFSFLALCSATSYGAQKALPSASKVARSAFEAARKTFTAVKNNEFLSAGLQRSFAGVRTVARFPGAVARAIDFKGNQAVALGSKAANWCGIQADRLDKLTSFENLFLFSLCGVVCSAVLKKYILSSTRSNTPFPPLAEVQQEERRNLAAAQRRPNSELTGLDKRWLELIDKAIEQYRSALTESFRAGTFTRTAERDLENAINGFTARDKNDTQCTYLRNYAAHLKNIVDASFFVNAQPLSLVLAHQLAFTLPLASSLYIGTTKLFWKICLKPLLKHSINYVIAPIGQFSIVQPWKCVYKLLNGITPNKKELAPFLLYLLYILHPRYSSAVTLRAEQILTQTFARVPDRGSVRHLDTVFRGTINAELQLILRLPARERRVRLQPLLRNLDILPLFTGQDQIRANIRLHLAQLQ